MPIRLIKKTTAWGEVLPVTVFRMPTVSAAKARAGQHAGDDREEGLDGRRRLDRFRGRAFGSYGEQDGRDGDQNDGDDFAGVETRSPRTHSPRTALMASMPPVCSVVAGRPRPRHSIPQTNRTPPNWVTNPSRINAQKSLRGGMADLPSMVCQSRHAPKANALTDAWTQFTHAGSLCAETWRRQML